MPLVASSYRAPWWLPGGHLQTIVPATFVPRPRVTYRRERWDTPDTDFIAVDFAQPEPLAASAPLLVLFHGLEGGSDSHYARAVMRHFADRGWRALVAHFRGCGGEPNLLPRAYHSGDSDEADWILRHIHARWPSAPLHAIGVSLGGNVLAKWLGERSEDASFVRAAASIGSPLDLAAGGAALGRGFNLVYTRLFLATLKRKALAKLARWPDIAQIESIRTAATLHAYDNAFTAPVHGFRDADDYWTRASGKRWLGGVRVPHLVLNARNDPFVPAASLPGAGEVSPFVTLEQPATGGHIGFAEGAPPGSLAFLPRRLEQFFAAV
ncbi:MAG TPA: alpha/beta fold hydrolase [Burkholderiaceae bacterium]|nr:alpha/beta fold hydrolase [Burkholderiaceae bacterium]